MGEDLLPLLGGLQLADSAFPSGLYALSHGLESYVEAGLLGADGLEELIADLLRFGIGPSDGVALAVAHRALLTDDADLAAEADQRLSAAKMTREPREASARAGKQLIGLASALFDHPFLTQHADRVKRGELPGNHAVARGLAEAALGNSAERALAGELYAFDTDLDEPGVGRPGKVGMLELDFEVLGGATRIANHHQRFPLQAFRPIHLNPHEPEMAFVYVMSHGGTVRGNRYRLDLTCGPGATAHVTTQSAAKIYRMDRNYASQIVHLKAGPESVLEYLPEPVIPCRDSRFCGRIELEVHPTATVILGETLLPGRVAHGEHHVYTIHDSRIEVRSTGGELLFTDALKFEPRRASPHSPGRLGSHAVFASLYAISQRVRARLLADRLHARLVEFPDVRAGVSELPNGAGAWVRILSANSIDAAAALHAAWDEARVALIGAGAPNRCKT